MTENSAVAPPSKVQLWTGRVLSTIIVLFLTFDAVGKFLMPKPVIEACAHLGIPLAVGHNLGYILLFSVVLYAIPQTSMLGAILITGYLGGAVSIHLRVGDPIFAEALFPVYFGIITWLGLYLRDTRIRALVPFRG